jgi:hypothetical protein
MKFGNLVTYTGKYLSTAKTKAENGNLVFAKITGSTEIAEGSENYATDYDKDGYYIYAGGAEALLVDLDTFKSLKSEVKALQTKVGTFDEVDVPAYVQARIAELGLGDASKKGVATTIRDIDTATDEALATEKAVRTAVDAAIAAIPEVPVKDVTLNGTTVVGEDGVAAFTADTTVTKGSANLVTSGAVEAAISSLGDVMSFIGVVSAVPTDANVTLTDGTTVVAGKGDVITIASTDAKSGTEYVWTGTAWVEIGRVAVDEAVTSIGNVKGDIALGSALKIADSTLDVKLAATQGNVTLDTTDGLSASVEAENIEYTNTSHIDTATEVKSVKEALDEIFEDELVIANSLVDLNSRMEGAEGDIADLKAGLEAVAVTEVVDGDDSDFVAVTPATEGTKTTYTVSATVVKGANGGDAGLATDAYVNETVANSVDAALTWTVLKD